jgi:limonene-1,2-epoxide hydrolase
MRLTIVPISGTVSKNGISYNNLDLSFMPSNIHAVQWYDTFGEVEVKDVITNKMIANEPITDITIYNDAIALWEEANTRAEILKAELELLRSQT